MASKSLVYKVAKFNDETDTRSLQLRLESALKKKQAAAKRRQSTESESHFRLVNYNGPYKGMRVGEMFDYTAGATQPTARMDAKAEEWALDSVSPADKLSEFLHSIMYFGIRKNSVILSQSMSLRSLQFEDYINWLLRETGELKGDDFVALNDQPPADKAKQIKNTKGVTFVAPVDLKPSEAPSRSNTASSEVTGTKSISITPSGNMWESLQAFLPPEVKLPSKMKSNDIIQKRSLEVTVTLSWNRTYQNDPTDFMDSFSNQLRHVESELDYTIHTKSGTVTRDELKLRRVVSVPENDKGLLKKEEMWERMYDWLATLVSDNTITVDEEK